MTRRYGLRDEQWKKIENLLPGRTETVGVTAKDNRLFVEAVLYRYRAGIAWRDLPERFGDFRVIHTRHMRWSRSGAWQRVFEHLAKDAELYFDYYAWGSTYTSAYAFSARSKKWVLCDSLPSCSKESDFLGDGIVPTVSQSAVSIGGNVDTISNKGVIHVEETSQARVDDINKALSSIY